jgi:hypothetical protein
MQTFNTKQFTYHKETNSFVAEASDLGTFMVGQNFRLVSEKTGDTLDAQLLETKRDDDNDITHWEYELCNVDGYTGIKVIVFND